MALRLLARKLRIPATAALQLASSAHVASATGSLTSRSSQSGGARRAMNGIRHGRRGPKNLSKLEKRVMLEREKNKQIFKKLSESIDNLPRNIALTCGGGTLALTCAWAYLCDAFHKSRKFPA